MINDLVIFNNNENNRAYRTTTLGALKYSQTNY